MLFRKFTLSADNKTETPEAPALPALNGKPIYILGDTALAYFLAVKLIAAGHKVTVMAGQTENTILATNGITVKEDYRHIQK